MFLRSKKTGSYTYLQLVHNQRVDGHVRQQVLATLGREDTLRESGQLDALLHSLARFSAAASLLPLSGEEALEGAETIRIGGPLVFGRLWEETRVGPVLRRLLEPRHFEFDVERAVYLTVLHRLFSPGSDRAAEYWRHLYRLPGTEALELHQLYRAMAWLGEELPARDQAAAAPFAARTVKDHIEEALFAERRDLFSGLDLVFFDTTSLYFEGAGGEEVGRYGNSKDHRPDRHQIVVGAVLDERGRPIASELWPGNTTDAKTLLPVVERLRHRFGIGELCVVADRGMVSKKTVGELEAGRPPVHYVLGARLRAVKEIRDVVLSRGGRYHEVRRPAELTHDPSPLQVKSVRVGERRYIVCLNEEQARKDAADREAILTALDAQLTHGDKRLVGNKGYRKYLKGTGPHFTIDWAKADAEARYDGKWVLQTDLDTDVGDVALKYKELWQVEAVFRSVKSVLETRPIYHQTDAAIRGHIFASFLALVLLRELQARMEARGWRLEWARLRQDLDALEEVRVAAAGQTLVLRTAPRGGAGRALQAAGVALGPAVRISGT